MRLEAIELEEHGEIKEGTLVDASGSIASLFAASLAAVTCRVKVPMMGNFPFAHLA